MPGRILARVFLGLLMLVALLAAAVVAIDTVPGHRLVTRLAGGVAPANGLRFAIGRIDGSIYGRMTLHDVVVRDVRGVVATIPAATIDWHPGALLDRRVSADLVEADLVTLLRRPVLLPTPPSPLLPDIDILVGRLAVHRLVLEAAVTGRREQGSIAGTADIADGRARITADAAAAAGDRLTLRLDAVPDADRFMVDAHLAAPVGGIVDGLAKFGRPLAFDLAGRGSWTDWRGTAAARLGGDRLADLALTARNGRFTARGSARPGLVMAGPVARLTDPALAIDASAVAANRVVDVALRLSSTALDVAARGRVDLGQGRYGGLRVDARLLKPDAILADVRGRDVRAALVLDGPFATPTVDYTITAGTIGFGTTLLEQVRAAGIAVVDAGRVALPVHLTAARVTGIAAASGGLLHNVRVDGDLRITAKQVASDNLRLRSDQIDATMIVAASLATGEYNAALKGRVNRYVVAGLGVVDLVTDATLVPAGGGQFRVRGTVRATTLRIDNASARDFLGGNAVATAAIDRAPDGLISVAALRLTAPRFRILDGRGSYRPDGRIAFAAAATSAQYGPLAVTVGGTVASPVATLRAAHPNVGVQLTAVEATLRPAAGGGYAVTASGGSPYGAFAADVGLKPGPGPLTIDVRRASLAGLVVAGQVRATAAGPYAGALTLTGSGLAGTLRLGAEGKVQRVDAALRATNARVPLPRPLTIAQGTLDATAILYPDAPAIRGSAVFAGVRQGTLNVAHLKAAGDYRGGSGRLDLTADGDSGVPFTVAANAGFAPGVIHVAGSGAVDGIPLRLAAPAEIHRTRTGWALLPATLLLPQGRVAVAGTTGATTTLDATLAAVDLSIVEAIEPGLGLGGKASGRVAFTLPAGGALPTGRADLAITGFTRAGLATLSTPIDVAVLARLTPAGADASAVLRQSGTVLGRLQ
ncbi:MAG: hypothetical protein ACRYG4_22165, partial [Janthinobacterium lividum]